MYRDLYLTLPGPAWVRIVILAVVAAAVITALFLWVFPATGDVIDNLFPVTEATVDSN